MPQVFGFHDKLNERLAVLIVAYIHAPDVGVVVGDHGGQFLQHPRAVVAENGDLHRVCLLYTSLWSAHVLEDAPEKVVAVHRAYLEAGADCLLTASYQVSRMGYAEIGLDADEADAALLQRCV